MQPIVGRQKKGHGPRRSVRRPWKRGRACCTCAECAVFCEERFVKNRSLYVHLTYKDVDRFRKGRSIHCLKASQVGKVQARNVLVR